jgi:hypothetical protein
MKMMQNKFVCDSPALHLAPACEKYRVMVCRGHLEKIDTDGGIFVFGLIY